MLDVRGARDVRRNETAGEGDGISTRTNLIQGCAESGMEERHVVLVLPGSVMFLFMLLHTLRCGFHWSWGQSIKQA